MVSLNSTIISINTPTNRTSGGPNIKVSIAQKGLRIEGKHCPRAVQLRSAHGRSKIFL